MVRLTAVLVVLLASATLALADPEVRFDFDGFPQEISGAPGEKREFQAYATMFTDGDEVHGGWSLSMTADGAEIIDLTVSGLSVDTSSGDVDLNRNHFFSIHEPRRDSGNEVVHAEDPERHGAISIILALNYPGTTPRMKSDVVHRLARLTVQVELPSDGETRDVVLRHEDGFMNAPAIGPGVENSYLSDGMSLPPTETGTATIVLRGSEIPFRRADSNVNGEWDLSDVVYTLGHLFLGGERPVCEKGADSNDDGKIDISDPILLLHYLFYGGRPPSEPFTACGLDETEDALTCDSYPPCQ